MEKKLRKLELIEVPMSELEQEALDEILAGYWCESYHVNNGHGSCTSFFVDHTCALPGNTSQGNYCNKYTF